MAVLRHPVAVRPAADPGEPGLLGRGRRPGRVAAADDPTGIWNGGFSRSPGGRETRRGGDGERGRPSPALSLPVLPITLEAALAPRPRRKRITSADLLDFLAGRGYTFRLNRCDDSVEVNGERVTDVLRAEMRTKLRDAGFAKYLAAAEDALVAAAARDAYHPVHAYLQGLTWDGERHISRLAGHFQDSHKIFGLYLRKWLVGAVARAYTGRHNAMLVLDGSQGLGKSQFAAWLCPLPGLYVDAPIFPDDKDCNLLALRSWVWEVSELGATTRRADMEALKGFLAREVFTLRPPYGRFEIAKPGLASFIGTVNNSAGVFSDPTGSRRFWATTLTAINWDYAWNVDRDQVWAEAHAAYKGGEDPQLTPDEASGAAEINATFEVEDPVENLLYRHFKIDPADGTHWTSTADILTTLQANGLQGDARANAMYLSAALKKIGLERCVRGQTRGYLGIW